MTVYRVITEAGNGQAEAFPRTLTGLCDALYRALWLSVADATVSVLYGDKVIRRFTGGKDVTPVAERPARNPM